MPDKSVMVTGASGFVGQFLSTHLIKEGWRVRGTLLASENPSSLVQGVEPVTIESLSGNTSWRHALTGIDIVIHLAARVHVMDDPESDPLMAYRTVNVDGTTQLAREAALANVKRLIFMSSIKVNGEESAFSYKPDSVPQPSDPYGISKWEAEQSLRQIESETALEIVVIRPTLVYGPGVKANFLTMMRTIQRGIPLPFGSIKNKRSLIYIGNLVDAITTCATHPDAAGSTFLVSDGEDVSTPELIVRTASALNLQARLFSVPLPLMKLAGVLAGKSASVNRLTGSLTVDTSKIRRELGWYPPFTMQDGLQTTADWFKQKYGILQ